MKPIHRILLTGAAGALGRQLRPYLKDHCTHLRLTDMAEMEAAADHEEVVVANLADRAAVLEMTRDVDAVVYMAGKGFEGGFDDIFDGHVKGLYNVFEGMRQNGGRRVVWASSIHAVGFHPFSQVIDAETPTRPDTTYGVAKVCGEAIASLYWDKHRIESVSMRIVSCVERPENRRHLSTWLSYPDLCRMVGAALTCPRTDHSIVYGVSANTHAAQDNRLAAHLGYRPEDNAEAHRARIEAETPAFAPGDPDIATHGGPFATMPHYGDD
ncbi:NAD(P)-dependent oxidoreductase [Rhodobacteraceae bacterium CCMM004]|nr:NAD(P)-dependent oxidoreductase [Rhodobacteraceae bacterium CCMM004]